MASEMDDRPNLESKRKLIGWLRVRFTARRVLVTMLGVVVLVLCAYGGTALYQRLIVKDDSDGNSKSQSVFSGEETTAYNKYNDLVREKKYQEADKFIDTMPITNGAKASLHKSLSQITTGYDAKITAVKEQEKSGTMTAEGAHELADIYYQSGSTEQAREYYQKAIALYEKMPQTLDIKLAITSMEDRINER